MLCMYHVAQKLRNETVSEQTATITVRADTQKTQQVAYLRVYVFLRLLCTGKDPAEYESAQVCLEHCTRRGVWSFRRENINPKEYGIRIINTPGNTIKKTCKSAECSWSLCHL